MEQGAPAVAVADVGLAGGAGGRLVPRAVEAGAVELGDDGAEGPLVEDVQARLLQA